MASSRGHALIDRELYLPKSWIDDRDRCRAAGIDDEVEFATKSALAQMMIARALEAGVPCRWVTADEAYGQVKYLRVWLESYYICYGPRRATLVNLAWVAGSRWAIEECFQQPKAKPGSISTRSGMTESPPMRVSCIRRP